jgi:hypothetical protein
MNLISSFSLKTAHNDFLWSLLPRPPGWTCTSLWDRRGCDIVPPKRLIPTIGPSHGRWYGILSEKQSEALQMSSSVCLNRTSLFLLLIIGRSICQRTSRQPLQITKPMLDLLVAGHEIGPSFWAVPSCFYRRSDDLEGVFCLPFTESCSGSINGTFNPVDIDTVAKFKKQKYLTLWDTPSTSHRRTNGSFARQEFTTDTTKLHPKVFSYCSILRHNRKRIRRLRVYYAISALRWSPISFGYTGSCSQHISRHGGNTSPYKNNDFCLWDGVQSPLLLVDL